MFKRKENLRGRKDGIKDISRILKDWPKDIHSITARIIEADDGMEFLQIRLSCGILQMYLDGRPDGEEICGFQTFLEYLEHEYLRFGDIGKVESIWQEMNYGWSIWDELDREIRQFYHRRLGLLAVGRDSLKASQIALARMAYHRAARDADYNLRAIDFISRYCGNEEYLADHQGYEPFVIWHKVLAMTQLYLIDDNLDEAIEYIKAGVNRIEQLYRSKGLEKYARKDPAMAHLNRLERLIRSRYGIKATLHEQLKLAIEKEDYEQAARIRDILKNRGSINISLI